MADLTGWGTLVLAGCALAGGVGLAYKRGGSEGRLADSLDNLTAATDANTTAIQGQAVEYSAHKARSEVIHEEHQRMLVQHDKRLGAVERRPGPAGGM